MKRLTLLAMFVSAILIAFGFRQSDSPTRPWVAVTAIQVSHLAIHGSDAAFTLAYTLRDFGATPAAVHIAGALVDANAGPAWDTRVRQLCAVAAAIKPSSDWYVLPGIPAHLSLAFDGSEQTLSDGVPAQPYRFTAGKRVRLKALGCVSYRSTADGDVHVTGFAANISRRKAPGRPYAFGELPLAAGDFAVTNLLTVEEVN